MWQCRSPLHVLDLDQPRQTAMAAGSDPPDSRLQGRRRQLAAVLAQLGLDVGRGQASRTPPARSCTWWWSLWRRRTRRTRTRAALCAPPLRAVQRCACPSPVKCCSRLPSWLGLAIRRSTLTPEWVRAFAPALAGGGDALDLASVARLLASVTGLRVTAIRSMSFTLSAIRRAEPAISTSVPSPPTLAQSRRPASRRAAAPSGSSSRGLRSHGSGSRRASRAPPARSASNFAPRPALCATLPASAASRNDSSESIPSSECSSRARLGPSPGSRVIAISPGRDLRAQLLRRRDRARVDQREDLLLQASRRCPQARLRARRAPARPPTPVPRAPRARRCDRRARGARSRRRAHTGRRAPPAHRRSPSWTAPAMRSVRS